MWVELLAPAPEPNTLWALKRKRASRRLQAILVDQADYTSRDRVCQQKTSRDAERARCPRCRSGRIVARSVSHTGRMSPQEQLTLWAHGEVAVPGQVRTPGTRSF
jgi:hypothetical protein